MRIGIAFLQFFVDVHWLMQRQFYLMINDRMGYIEAEEVAYEELCGVYERRQSR